MIGITDVPSLFSQRNKFAPNASKSSTKQWKIIVSVMQIAIIKRVNSTTTKAGLALNLLIHNDELIRHFRVPFRPTRLGNGECATATSSSAMSRQI
jgi:hypothetical protein